MSRRVRFTRRRIERISRTASLGGLFLSFLKIGLVGFGGGVAVLAMIRNVTVRKRHWLTDSEFAEAVALAQSLPGTSAGNSVTYIGVRLRGWRGATVAMAGFILPSMLIMIALAIGYKHVHNLAGSERFFHGLNGAVVALILVTAWRMGKSILTARWQWVLAVISFLAVAILNATVLEVVFAAGLIGIYIDSIAEKQWQRLRNLRTFVARRRTRIRTRLAKRRRSQQKGVDEEPEESMTLRSVGMFAPSATAMQPLAIKALASSPRSSFCVAQGSATSQGTCHGVLPATKVAPLNSTQ